MNNRSLSLLFLTAGMLSFYACTEDQTGNTSEIVPENIEFSIEREVKETSSSNSNAKKSNVVEQTTANPSVPLKPIPVGSLSAIQHPKIPEIVLEEQAIGQTTSMPEVEDEIVEFPEVEAEYIGEPDALLNYIVENIQFPEIDKKAGTKGEVLVGFIIEKDGSLSNIKVLRGVTSAIDEEAKRIIRSMPKWKPAEDDGIIVRSRMRLPIVFTLM